eukprot:m.12704 g.12704  ORF g.12704 m.12704 type:complete len:458 (+) comp24242_c0_seq1:50-1423(+)
MASGLHEILERASVDHRSDIRLLCSGHLNENNLLKPPSQRRKPWSSAKALRSSALQSFSSIAPRTKDRKKRQYSPSRSGKTDAIFGFTLGPFPARPSTSDDQSSPSHHDDEPAVTEASSRRRLSEPLSLQQHDVMVRGSAGSARFITPYTKEVRKRDQFQRWDQVDKEVVARTKSHQRNALLETDAVNEIRRKTFHLLPKRSSGVSEPPAQRLSYHRLQMYSSALGHIADANATYGPLLTTIRKAYDKHVSSLLDDQSHSQQNRLHLEVRRRELRSSERPNVLLTVERRVAELEPKVQDLLTKNNCLREELQREKSAEEIKMDIGSSNRSKTATTAHRTATVGRLTSKKDLTVTVERLHKELYQKIEMLKSTRRHLYQEMVPSLECLRLEHCLKETEANIQKLLKHNDYLQEKIEELECDLERHLEETEAPQKDIRLLWKKVNAFKSTLRNSSETNK